MKRIFSIFLLILLQTASLPSDLQEKKGILESERFLVHSTFKKKETREFSRAMEDFSKQAEQIYSVKPKQPFSVHLFAVHKEFFEFVKQSGNAGMKYAGGFFNPQKSEIAVFWQGSEQETLSTLFHEISHAYTSLAFVSPPQAIHEGLATFFEASSLRFHKVETGRVHRGYLEIFLKMAEANTLTPISSFLDIQGYNLGQMHETFGSKEYAEAWALIYYCLLGPEEVQKKFREYLQFLRVRPDPGGMTFQSLLTLNEEGFQKKWIAFMKNLNPKKQDRKNKTLQFPEISGKPAHFGGNGP